MHGDAILIGLKTVDLHLSGIGNQIISVDLFAQAYPTVQQASHTCMRAGRDGDE